MEQPVVRVERVEYYYTVVPNRVGAGAKVFNELKAQNVSLTAFNGFPLSAQSSQLDLVPSSGAALVAAAQKAGIKLVGPKVAFMISEWEHIGAVADILSKLEQAGVNVTAMQAIETSDWRYGAIIWVEQHNIGKAAKALGIS
jgi:cellobiose-specific phosphotransferase system component IIB